MQLGKYTSQLFFNLQGFSSCSKALSEEMFKHLDLLRFGFFYLFLYVYFFFSVKLMLSGGKSEA